MAKWQRQIATPKFHPLGAESSAGFCG